jgi:hypothetical protein
VRYDFNEIEPAVQSLCARLKVAVDARLQIEFEEGYHPSLLAHERIHVSPNSPPVLIRHMMCALSCAHQPVTHYDIFRACRSVTFVLLLDAALVLLDAKRAGNLDDRLERLVRESAHESFDAVFFEIITAARYAALPDTQRVTFIKETQQKTPDILVVRESGRLVVECKKSDRIREHHMNVRDLVRQLLVPVNAQFRQEGIGFSGEVVFHDDPVNVSATAIQEAFRDAVNHNTSIVTKTFTAVGRKLVPIPESEFPLLYPSPAFNWMRYQYRIRSNWFGLVQEVNAGFGHWAWTPPNLRNGASTWMHSVSWDAGIKWRIDHADTVNRYRRFAFSSVFKGLVQLQQQPEAQSVLHVWIESDYFLQSRKDVLLDLFSRLKEPQRGIFSWVIVNETLWDISPKGYFDLIENAHLVKGPTAASGNPAVSAVFTSRDEDGGTGGFGVGAALPDIDA